MKKILLTLCTACALILTFACSKVEESAATLGVSPAELKWEWNETQSQTVTVTANYEWTAKVSDESKWTLTPANDGKTFIVAPKAENRTSNALTATITVTCKELTKTITCTQAGGDFIDGYEYVDLGLTVDWATWNVGANSESDCGQYFAWGEASEKNDYTWETYKWGTYNSSDKTNYGMTRYNATDGLTTLQAGDDPATAAWGSKWRTPTRKEVKDLLDETNCEWKWTTKNGVEGYLVISKVAGFEGKSIFLPITGYCRNSSIKDETKGYYWSSSVDAYIASNAFYYYFASSYHQGIHDTRQDGLAVRAVANSHPERDVTGGVEAVDLGLSVKWASWNVGAKSETDYGQYFAWGETAEKTDYSWDTYKWGKDDISAGPDKGMTKYNKTDGITTLEASDDPATANWGSKWRSPSFDEIKELLDDRKCVWTWVTKKDANGADVTGYTVTSKINGNSIFLPAASYRYGTELKDAGEYGSYWSSSLGPSNPNRAYSFSFDSGSRAWFNDYRFYGQSVRAVTE